MSSLKRKMKRSKEHSKKVSVGAIRAVKQVENNSKVEVPKMTNSNFFVENAMKQLRAKDVANILAVNKDINDNKSFNVLNALTPNVKNVIQAYAVESGIDINDRQAMTIFAKITLGTMVNEYHIDELYGDFVKEINKAFSTISLIEEMIISRKDRYERLFVEIANKEGTTEEEKKKLLAMSKAFSESYRYEEALANRESEKVVDLSKQEELDNFYTDLDDKFKSINITLEKTKDIAKVVALILKKDENTVNLFIYNMNKYFDECAKSDELDIIPLVRKFYFFDILIMLTRLKEDEIEHDFTKQLISTLKDTLDKLQ